MPNIKENHNFLLFRMFLIGFLLIKTVIPSYTQLY